MNYDPVTIIGASNAGLYNAYLLARQGVPVRVLFSVALAGPAPNLLWAMERVTGTSGSPSREYRGSRE
jgi:2-polyprenyl-6-methoxyphenol hydroxylase-like FAD-dependent oxidoreductase